MKPYFSIIIPTYNRCNLVKKCIISLKKQSFSNWECIIINDGSTDNTESEIPELIKHDPRFIYINQTNLERAISRNNGAKKSTGKYLIFLDSDDYFEDDHLLNLNQQIVIDGERKALYFTNGKIIKDNNIEIIVKSKLPSKLPIDYFLNNSVVPARVCLHNEIFIHFNFDPTTIVVEDTVLWTEIMEKFPIVYLTISSVNYHWHGDNSVNIEKYNAYLQRLNGLKVLFYKKNVGKIISRKIKRKHLNRCYFGIADFYHFNNNKCKAIWWLIKSIIKYPELDLKHKLVRLTFFFKFASK